jgi:hypothetical protein
MEGRPVFFGINCKGSEKAALRAVKRSVLTINS